MARVVVKKNINLVDEFYGSMYEILTTGKASSSTNVAKFAQKNFDSLMKRASAENTSLPALEKLQSLVEGTQEWSDSKAAVDKEFTEFQISKSLIPWQRELFIDDSKRIALRCGRRAGKSWGLAKKGIRHCLDGYDTFNGVQKPRKVVIIGLTIQKCAEVFWEVLKDEIKKDRIPTSKIDNSDYSITFANGASIKLVGNNSKADREKLRGQEYSLIIIDEAQSQAGLRYLMDSILEPIAYGRDSQICMAGTGALCLGTYWEEITTGDRAPLWRQYHTTMEDNPTVANPSEVLAKVREDKGWTEDEPEYQREYLAENVWDTTRLVISNKKYYTEIPKIAFAKCIIGADYGFEDYNSFVPVLVAVDGKRYVSNVWKQNHCGASDIVTKAKEIAAWAVGLGITQQNVIFVADTSDQSISQDIWRQGIHIVNAYKADEKMQWAKLKERMATGDLLIEEGGVIDKETSMTIWKYDEDKKSVVYEIDDDFYHPEAMDALKYANYYLDTNKAGDKWK